MNRRMHYVLILAWSISSLAHAHLAPLKILYVVDEFPKFNQPFVLDQIVGLIQRGHDVYILADNQPYPEMIPMDVHTFDLLKRTWYQHLPLDQHTFDIICCNFGQSGCWAAKLMHDGKLKGKLVTIFHGADITRFIHRKSGIQFFSLGDYRIPCYTPLMYQELFATGDAFLGVCSYFRNLLIALGAHPAKVGVHHVGIDCAKFGFKRRSLQSNELVRIATCGRLVEKKGIHVAVRAIAQVVKRYPNLIFEIIGDGPMRSDIEHLIKNLGIQHCVRMHGWQSHERVVDILDACHMFILPSMTGSSGKYVGDQEGVPTVLMEAMALGLPVISTFHSGIPELVRNGMEGYLVPEGCVNSLARKIMMLIERPVRISVMGAAGRRIVDTFFNREKQNEKLIHLFYSLVGDTGLLATAL